MAERFSRLFQLTEDMYSSGAPVLVVAGALLKDSVTDSLVAQMKFQNLSVQTVIAAKVKLCAYDVAGAEISGIDAYQYLDINIHTGECWGEDKAIIMPEASTRSFSVKEISVLFSNSGSWKTTDFSSAASLPRGIPLEREFTDPELVKQYQISVNSSAQTAPAQYGELWRCSCGAINKDGTCHSCHATKSVVFSSLDVASLSEALKVRILKEQAKEAAQKKQQEKRTRALKRIAAVGFPIIALGLLFAFWLYPYVLEPNSRYSNACNLVEAGQFDDAIKTFESLGDYRDASEQLKAAQYAKAVTLESVGDADEAIALYRALGDYEDSAARVKAIQYAEAVALAKAGEYEKAIEAFEALNGYEDAEDQILIVMYQMAENQLELGRYGEAAALFSKLGDYKDAAERVVSLQNSTFASFNDAIQSGRYEEARSIMIASADVWTPQIQEQAEIAAEDKYNELMVAGRTEDAVRLSETLQLSPEQTYSQAKDLLQSGDFDGAYSLLTGIVEYKNAEKLMTAIDNRIDGVYSYKDGYYMRVSTVINPETGRYTYSAARWVYLGTTHFSQGKLQQTSELGEPLMFHYAGTDYRWAVQENGVKIVEDEMNSNLSSVKESRTWILLNEEEASDALRMATYLNLI